MINNEVGLKYSHLQYQENAEGGSFSPLIYN